MGEVRIPKKGGEYIIPREKYLTAVHYCRQYPTWIKERRSFNSDAQKMQRLNDKIDLVERTVREAGPDIYQWLLRNVTEKGMAYERLYQRGIPCSRQRFYYCRRKFYFLISERL